MLKAQCSRARDILLCSYYVIEYVTVYLCPTTVSGKHFHFIANTQPVFDSNISSHIFLKGRCVRPRDILLCSYYVTEYVCLCPMTVSRKHFHFIAKSQPVFDSNIPSQCKLMIFMYKFRAFDTPINSQRNG